MGVSNELAKPETEDEFEAMCFNLYRRLWSDSSSMRVGRSGAAQFGVDILAHDGRRPVGIQCKHYVRKPFTFKTVSDDVEEADKAGLKIGHLLFATSAPNKAAIVIEVQELSEVRRAKGKFTVSVDFWNGISDHIRMHPEVGRAFIPGYPGGVILAISDTVNATHAIVVETARQNEAFREELREIVRSGDVAKAAPLPDAKGDESDPGVVASLDFVRDRLREGRTRDAREMLEKLGEPANLKDSFSRFRWCTNLAAIEMIEGNDEAAATLYLQAYTHAPDNEKALANRTYAYLIRKNYAVALAMCDEGLAAFPRSLFLWALRLNINHALGEADPEAGLPPDIVDTSDVLFARASVKGKQGLHEESVELFRTCLEKDAASLEARRAYLASALGWCALDGMRAFMGQISDVQRSHLARALGYMERLETTLPEIQADSASTELANNATSALMVLGEVERARSLTRQMLVRHPDLEGLIRIRLRELYDLDDMDGLKALTDERLERLPPSILAGLVEASANSGDVDWNARVLEVAERRTAEDEKLRQFAPLRFHALWIAGRRPEALEAAVAYARNHPDHLMGQMIAAQMLDRSDRHDEAVAIANASRARLDDVSDSLEVLHVADLHWHLKMPREAASLFERLVKVPGDNELTWKLLASLVNSDQRRKATRLLETLAPTVRALPKFRRIEINVARRMGNWWLLRDLLKIEVDAHPSSADAAAQYAGALFRTGDREAFEAFLRTDPQFEDAGLDAEVEFAKYQVNAGLLNLAALRLYKKFRNAPTSSEAAGALLGQILTMPRERVVAHPTMVASGTAAHVQGANEGWWIAIDDVDRLPGGWPELVAPDSPVALALIGRSPGDVVELRRGFTDQQVTINSIVPLLTFAVQKAQEVVAANADPTGPIWNVRIVNDDGSLDVEMLLKSALERRRYVERMLATYAESRFPLSVLAKLLSTDLVTLTRDWPGREARMFVDFGNGDEREAARSLLDARGKRVVMDLVALTELHSNRVLYSMEPVLGRPLIPQSVREHLVVLIEQHGPARETKSMGEHNGRLQLITIPAKFSAGRERFLRGLLRYLDTHCDVVATAGPEQLTEEQASIGEYLDKSTHDAILLALEYDAILLSEDGGLKVIAQIVGVTAAMGVQPVLMTAVSRRVLKPRAYALILGGKILRNHDFVSVSAADLLSLALEKPLGLVPAVRKAIDGFRSATLDIDSALNVVTIFSGMALRMLPAATAGRYISQAVDALCDGRPEIEPGLRDGFAAGILRVVGRNGRRLRPHERRAFGNLIKRMR